MIESDKVHHVHAARQQALIDTLRSIKQKATWRSFLLIHTLYSSIFSRWLRRLKDYRTFTLQDLAELNPSVAPLDKDKNYFVLHASYGDKWCILSLIPEHLRIYKSSIIIASYQDRELVELFLGAELTASKFIFIYGQALQKLSYYFCPVSMLAAPLADTWYVEGCKHTVTSFFIEHGLPPGTIRHLHFVYYPYFNDLHNIHGVSYGKLLKTILYLPAASQPSIPSHYGEDDSQHAQAISASCRSGSVSSDLPAILLNVVNFSHAPLDSDQVSLIINTVEANGYRVLINTTQGGNAVDSQSPYSAHQNSVEVEIPARLMALVCNNVKAVIGVLGGAMNVAVQFSGTHVLSLQTPSLGTGCPDDELYGEWGEDKYWEWVDKDWPCLFPGRVVLNKYIDDPKTLNNDALREVIQSFLQKLPETA